eukprot:170131-Amphidinium_carterae.3
MHMIQHYYSEQQFNTTIWHYNMDLPPYRQRFITFMINMQPLREYEDVDEESRMYNDRYQASLRHFPRRTSRTRTSIWVLRLLHSMGLSYKCPGFDLVTKHSVEQQMVLEMDNVQNLREKVCCKPLRSSCLML